MQPPRPWRSIKHRINADEPTPFRTVISCIEVAEAAFGVVVVAAIAERVDIAHGGRHGSGNGDGIAPSVIDIDAEFSGTEITKKTENNRKGLRRKG